jgi:hypothetical protein
MPGIKNQSAPALPDALCGVHEWFDSQASSCGGQCIVVVDKVSWIRDDV